MTHFRVQDFLDRQRIRSIHIVVLALCAAIMFVDGLDIFMVGKIAPAIAAGMGEAPSAMTRVFVAQQIGLALGAFMATPFADRFGRRTTIIACAGCFGALTVMSAFATSLWQLAVLRGLAGIFLSGVLPMAVALVAEVTPRYRRGTFIAIAMMGYSLGNAAGGAVAAWLIDLYGWQSGFWIGGLMPLAMIPIMLMFLPESIQFLAGRNARHPRIPAILGRFDPHMDLKGDEVFLAGDSASPGTKSNPLEIFRGGRAGASVILWLVCFLSMGNIALLAAWLPTFFQEKAGVPIQQFALYAMIAYSGGLAGTLAVGWLLDRCSPARLIATIYVLQSLCIASLGQLAFGGIGFVGLFIAFSCFQTGGQAALNLLLAQSYPAAIRTTGIGWAGGMGRIGGIVGPLLGGIAVAADISLAFTLTLVAVPPLIVAIVISFLSRTGMDRPLLPEDPSTQPDRALHRPAAASASRSRSPAPSAPSARQ